MIKFVLALLLATATFSACHKEKNEKENINGSQVPNAVTAAFNAKYPSASGQIEWEKEDGNTYKVKYFIGSQRWQAMFNADGSFVSEKKI